MITMPPNFSQFIAEENLTSRPLSPTVQGFFAADQLKALSVWNNPWHTLIWPNTVSPLNSQPIISRFRDFHILREWAFATMAGLVECTSTQDETLTLTQHFRIPYPYPSLQPSFSYDTHNDRWGYPSLQAFRISIPVQQTHQTQSLSKEHQMSLELTSNPFLYRVDFLDPNISQLMNHASLDSMQSSLPFPDPPNPLIHTYHTSLSEALHYMTRYFTGKIPRPTQSEPPPHPYPPPPFPLNPLFYLNLDPHTP